MINIKNLHFSRSSRLSPRFYNTCISIVSFHKTNRSRCPASTSQCLSRTSQRRPICTCPRTCFKQISFSNLNCHNRIHIVLCSLYKTCRTLRPIHLSIGPYYLSLHLIPYICRNSSSIRIIFLNSNIKPNRRIKHAQLI